MLARGPFRHQVIPFKAGVEIRPDRMDHRGIGPMVQEVLYVRPGDVDGLAALTIRVERVVPPVATQECELF